MLTLFDSGRKYSRREMLRIGALGLGGLTLADRFRAQSLAGEGSGVVRDKAVVLLFMQGGPSQFETFDPKMTAPVGIRSATGEVQTALPGVTFGATFERLAALANELVIVRSYRPGDASHNIKPILCPETLKASLGAIYGRVAGITRADTGMPTSAVLYPRSVDSQALESSNNFGSFADSGQLGASYAPFVPGAGPLHDNMQLHLSRERLDDRRLLLAQLDRIHRAADKGGLLDSSDKFQQQAFTVLLRGVADAFNLAQEDPAVIARYDTAPLINVDQISTRWKNRPKYIDHARSLGKQLLLARRLCEAGCGLVTISTGFVWDNHADANNAGVVEGMGYCGLPFDRAVSAFLQDVRQRGLADKILLVCCGEMGRTPRINTRGGRDHWGELGPLLLAGGGISGGKVIGQSTRDGGAAQGEPVSIKNLLGTLSQTLFDVGRLRLERNLPTDLLRLLTENEPIPGLV